MGSKLPQTNPHKEQMSGTSSPTWNRTHMNDIELKQEIARLAAELADAKVKHEAMEAELARLREKCKTIDALNALREEEGACVSFYCDNPDYNGLPDAVVEVMGGWTKWETHAFHGDSILACLTLALETKTAAEAEKAVRP